MTSKSDDGAAWEAGSEARSLLDADADALAEPLRHQDALIAAAAARTAAQIRGRNRRERWTSWPLALAAGLAAGILLAPVLPEAGRSPGVGLTLPGDVTRGGEADGGAVPVTDADPGTWYRYIQELVYRGDFAEAERHLAAFNRLHPEYREGS